MVTSSDIIMFRGNDGKWRITVTKDGVAYDLTGATLDFYVKRKVTEANADAIIHKTTDDGISEDDYSEGKVFLTIEADDTDGLEIGKNFVYDIELETAILKLKYTILRGIFRLRQD